MRDHAGVGLPFKFTSRRKDVRIRTLALMVVLVAIAASSPAHLLGAAIKALITLIRVFGF